MLTNDRQTYSSSLFEENFQWHMYGDEMVTLDHTSKDNSIYYYYYLKQKLSFSEDGQVVAYDSDYNKQLSGPFKSILKIKKWCLMLEKLHILMIRNRKRKYLHFFGVRQTKIQRFYLYRIVLFCYKL